MTNNLIRSCYLINVKKNYVHHIVFQRDFHVFVHKINRRTKIIIRYFFLCILISANRISLRILVGYDK